MRTPPWSALVFLLACASCGGGGAGGDAAPTIDAAHVCFNAACTTYCAGEALVAEGAYTRCPSELGSTCEVDPGRSIKCTCGTVPAAGSCFSNAGNWTNASTAVWATCYAPRSELSFHTCTPGRMCDEPSPCVCNPEPDAVCFAPAVCPGDPDCV